MSEEEIKQLKLERDTAMFVARERLDEIERIKNQKEIFELRYLKEERENDKLHSIIKEVREYIEQCQLGVDSEDRPVMLKYLEEGRSLLEILHRENI